MTAFDVLDRLADLGCAVRVEGEKLKVRGPDLPEVPPLVSELRARHEEAISILRERQCRPPTLEEVKAALPAGVRLVSYQPKEAPFAVAPVSIVADAGKFLRAYLRDLNWRLEHPDGHAAPPLADILSKLGDAGLELKIGKPGAFINELGLEASDEDLPF